MEEWKNDKIKKNLRKKKIEKLAENLKEKEKS